MTHSLAHSHIQSLTHSHSHSLPLPQLSDAAGAYDLNDRRNYKGFFRVISSFQFLASGLVGIARQFGWTQMAIITQEETLFTSVSIKFDHCIFYIHSY